MIAKRTFQQPGTQIADARQKALDRARVEATYGWDASPVSLPRLYAELWAQIKNEDWAYVGNGGASPLWNFDKFYRRLRGGTAAGGGFVAPGAVGAALAHRKYGRLCVHVQTDGDLMYGPGALWTSAHHKVPVLSVMHNNRAYHQEVMHIQRMSDRHERGITHASIGFDNPNRIRISISRAWREAWGVYGEGLIADPKDLGPAIQRAIAVVKRGQPALVDVVTQPR